MRNRTSIQMNDLSFSGEELISFINFPISFNRSWHSGSIHDGAELWLLVDFSSFPTGVAIKARLTLSSIDIIRTWEQLHCEQNSSLSYWGASLLTRWQVRWMTKSGTSSKDAGPLGTFPEAMRFDDSLLRYLQWTGNNSIFRGANRPFN